MQNIFCNKTMRNNVGPKEVGLVRSKCFIAVYIAFILFFLGHDSHHWARTSSFTRFLDHTQRRTTVGRTPVEE